MCFGQLHTPTEPIQGSHIPSTQIDLGMEYCKRSYRLQMGIQLITMPQQPIWDSHHKNRNLFGLQYNIYSLCVAYNTCGVSTATILSQITAICCGTITITDFDGNIYNTVQIGSQCWMQQNLKATHYANGTAMLDGTSAGDITGNFTQNITLIMQMPLQILPFMVSYTLGSSMNWDNRQCQQTPSGCTRYALQAACTQAMQNGHNLTG